MLCLEDADVDFLLTDAPTTAPVENPETNGENINAEEGGTDVAGPSTISGQHRPEPIVFQASAEAGKEPECMDTEMQDVKPQKRKRTNKNKKGKKKQPQEKMIYTDYERCHGNLPPAKLMQSALSLEHRMDVTMEIPRRQDTLHVFGVDIMGTSDMFGYFRKFNPLSVEWLNDSSCNVVLESEEKLEEAIGHLARPIPACDMPEDAFKDKGFCRTYLWYRARPFLKGAVRGNGYNQITQVHLMLRMATVEDTRPAAVPKVSRKLWMQNKDRVKEVLQQHGDLDHDLAEKQNNRKRKNWKNGKRYQKKKPKRNGNQENDGNRNQQQDGLAMDISEQAPVTNQLTEAANVMPSDLRDFITRLRSGQASGEGPSQPTLVSGEGPSQPNPSG